jgi:hypothetical protein
MLAAMLLMLCHVAESRAYKVSYQYDHLKRLTAAQYQNIGRIEYGYDASGNRLTTRVLSFLKGDVNRDSAVTLADAILALKTIAALKPAAYKDGDVNDDGRIGLIEAIFILQKISNQR